MNALAHAPFDTAGRVRFLVPDVRCANCCLKIERELGLLPDISDVNVSYAEKRLTFSSPSAPVTRQVIDRLDELGYPSTPELENEALTLYQDERRRMLARLGVAGIGMMQVMMFALAGYLAGPSGIEPAYEALMRWASLVITLPVALYSAMPFHRGALRDIRNLSPGMDVPVSLAIISAFTLSAANTLLGTGEVYFDSACMFTFFLLTGRFLELNARHAFHVDQSLGEHLLPPKSQGLKEGDHITIEPGEIVPGDAIVSGGTSSIDESAFTGEGEPVFKSAGSTVYAGSRNLDGQLQANVMAPKSDWVISHLSALYEKSAGFKPAFAILADRVARYFVAVILLLAFSSGLFWWANGVDNYFAIALAVLVVSCPCALSLATPICYSIASNAIRDMGVLIGEGAFLEKLTTIDTVVFDKTGTLTEGTLRLESVQLMDASLDKLSALTIAASLEVTSLHPVAATLLKEAAGDLDVTDREKVPGSGVSGFINRDYYRLGKPRWSADAELAPPDPIANWVLLTRNHVPVCWFAFSDRLRAGAEGTVASLQSALPHIEVYSGDSSASGRARVVDLGINNPRMNMSPEDKITALRQLQATGQHVLMVGDGLNDAGAMALADVSVAVNPVDSIVQSAADATLVNGDLATLPKLLNYAERVRAIIRQNLCWAFAYNLAVIPLAVMGLIAPWVAALGMSLSSLLVTLNAGRLARWH